LEWILPFCFIVNWKTAIFKTKIPGGIKMFGTYIRKTVCIGILLAAAMPALAQGGRGYGRRQAQGRGNGQCLALSTPVQSLESREEAGLLRMREEEKLARDVYQAMYSLWGDGTFQRISSSEQQHMDAVEVLLERYGLEDPVAGRKVGEFGSVEMQNLYRELVVVGQRSRVDALKVGARIEDLDLKDLGEALESNNNNDIQIVFENLARGSRNHMRAFAGRLEALGESYAPEYLSREELSAILSSAEASGAGRGPGARRRGAGRGACLRNLNVAD
jgi:hypothetical protein